MDRDARVALSPAFDPAVTDPSATATERAGLELFEQSLDHPPLERRAFIEAADTSTEAKTIALRLLEKGQRASRELRTGGAAQHLAHGIGDFEPPERLGAYRIEEKLGEGGMGAVFRGVREAGDFERAVAIKIVRPGLLSPEIIDRFRRERQILARFNHPNIAQLFDGGETADGAPYIVMELVDGLPLRRWIEAGERSLDARLELLHEVLSAAAFSHRNLVVHRDLTPGNILVTEEGHAKLIDFGISRPESDTGDGTGSTATPGFSAPEATGNTTTLSDIYALGAVMAELVAPFGEAELDAIAARASAKDPDARYETVEELDKDIADWRAGRAIDAYSTAPAYRARRFAGRHAIGIGIGAAVFAALIAGVIALQLSYRQERIAREAADQRFAEVRALSKFLLFDLYDTLEPVPGNTKALNRVAEVSRSYLDRLASIEGAPPELKLESATAYKRLADILGGARGSNLGRRDEAQEAIDTGIAQLRALRASEPANPAAIEALADALTTRAAIRSIGFDDDAGAIVNADEAAGLYGQLARQGYRRPAMVRAQIQSAIDAATAMGWSDRNPEALRRFAALEKRADRLAKTHGEREWRELLAKVRGAYAEAITWSEQTDETYARALGKNGLAIADWKALLDRPDPPSAYRVNLLRALTNRGMMLSTIDRDREGIAPLRQAETIARALQRSDPDDKEFQRRLSTVLGQLTINAAYANEPTLAYRSGAETLAIKRRLLADEPANPARNRELASTLIVVGEAHEVTGDTPTACRHYREAIALRDGESKRTGKDMADVYGMVAGAEEKLPALCGR